MEKDNKIMDDLAKLAGSAFAGAVNMKNDLSEYIKNQVESCLKKMNFITREEFEVVEKMAMDNSIALKKIQKTKESAIKSPATKRDVKRTKNVKAAI